MIIALTSRHMRVFFRDPASVFLSLLSALILFVLYTVFLGQVQVDNLRGMLPKADDASIDAFVHSWMFSGIVTISTMTTSLSALAVFVGDRVTDRFRDFLVSPITRFQMIASYLAAAFLTSWFMSTIVFVIGQAYLRLVDDAALGWAQALRAYALLVALCLLFSAIWSLAVTFIRSESAFMSTGTIVGTAGGFLCGAFISVGSLPGTVVDVMNVLPFNQAATLMRIPFTDHTISVLAAGDAANARALQAEYGTSVVVGSHELAVAAVLGIFAVLFAVFVGLGTWRIGRRIR